MQLNFRKTIVDQIDEAVAKAPRTVESVTLTISERAELYRCAGLRFRKMRDFRRPSFRGELRLASGRLVDVLAHGE
jgi:hypothetical protein